MAGQQLVEEHLIAVLYLGEQHVARQVGGLPLVLRIYPCDLLAQGQERGRNQPRDAQLPTFLLAEGGALVDPGIGEHLAPAQRRAPRAVLVQPQRWHAGPFDHDCLPSRRPEPCRCPSSQTLAPPSPTARRGSASPHRAYCGGLRQAIDWLRLPGPGWRGLAARAGRPVRPDPRWRGSCRWCPLPRRSCPADTAAPART